MTSTVIKRAVGEGASLALPSPIGLGSAAPTTTAGQGPTVWPTRSRRAGLIKASGKASENATPSANPGASASKMASDSTKKIAKKAAPKKYSASASGKAVRVKRGDTLSKIAKRHQVTGGWKGLWKLNKKTIKNPNLIFIGQVIKIK